MDELLIEEMARLKDVERRLAAAHAELVAAVRPKGGVRGFLSRFAARSAATAEAGARNRGPAAGGPAILSTAIRRESR